MMLKHLLTHPFIYILSDVKFNLLLKQTNMNAFMDWILIQLAAKEHTTMSSS